MEIFLGKCFIFGMFIFLALLSFAPMIIRLSKDNDSKK